MLFFPLSLGLHLGKKYFELWNVPEFAKIEAFVSLYIMFQQTIIMTFFTNILQFYANIGLTGGIKWSKYYTLPPGVKVCAEVSAL